MRRGHHIRPDGTNRATRTHEPFGDHHTPCASMPTMWDAPEWIGRGDGAKRELLAQAREAAALCIEACPSLAACQRLLADTKRPDGVIAGQIWINGRRVG